MQTQQEIEAAYKEWQQKTRAEGAAEARKETLVEAVEMACELLNIPITDERRKRLASWDLAQLERELKELRRSRRWPELDS